MLLTLQCRAAHSITVVVTVCWCGSLPFMHWQVCGELHPVPLSFVVSILWWCLGACQQRQNAAVQKGSKNRHAQ
jgi:hypothetical protein